MLNIAAKILKIPHTANKKSPSPPRMGYRTISTQEESKPIESRSTS